MYDIMGRNAPPMHLHMPIERGEALTVISAASSMHVCTWSSQDKATRPRLLDMSPFCSPEYLSTEPQNGDKLPLIIQEGLCFERGWQFINCQNKGLTSSTTPLARKGHPKAAPSPAAQKSLCWRHVQRFNHHWRKDLTSLVTGTILWSVHALSGSRPSTTSFTALALCHFCQLYYKCKLCTQSIQVQSLASITKDSRTTETGKSLSLLQTQILFWVDNTGQDRPWSWSHGAFVAVYIICSISNSTIA